MRGGDQYPGLIRKTEPKPLRIFLEDGSADTWNPAFGSWWLANQDMETALAYADTTLPTRGELTATTSRSCVPFYPRSCWRQRNLPKRLACPRSVLSPKRNAIRWMRW